jgi:hypothetical protein
MKCSFFDSRLPSAFVVVIGLCGCSSESNAPPSDVVHGNPSVPAMGSNTGNPIYLLDGCELPIRVDLAKAHSGAYFWLDPSGISALGGQSGKLAGLGTVVDESSGQCEPSGLLSFEFPWALEGASLLPDGSLEARGGDPNGFAQPVITSLWGGEAQVKYLAGSYRITISPDAMFDLAATLVPAVERSDAGIAVLVLQEELRTAGKVNVACMPGETDISVRTASGEVATIKCNGWYPAADSGTPRERG